MLGRHTSMNDILNDPILGNSFDDLIQRQSGSEGGLTTNDVNTAAGIVLDTTFIKKYSAPDFDNYTFKVVQDSIEERSLLRNYQLTVVNDTTFVQFLIDYPVNADGSYYAGSAVLTRIEGTELLPASMTDYFCGYTLTTSEESYCYEVKCKGKIGGQAAGHGLGDNCNEEGLEIEPICNVVHIWLPFPSCTM